MNRGKKELFQKWYWGKGVMIGKKKKREIPYNVHQLISKEREKHVFSLFKFVVL